MTESRKYNIYYKWCMHSQVRLWRHSNWQMKRGQPRNRWQTQHPWRQTKPSMAYTLLLMFMIT